VATNPLQDWLAEVAADAIVVRPHDTTAEARGNLWAFSLDHWQRSTITSAEAEEFVRAVAAARGRWLAEHGSGQMRFYCWHDAQAGQLRLSLVSTGPAPLPFECPVDSTADLAAVVSDFLGAAAVATRAPLPGWVIAVPA
jgi:hypothetical protein